MVERIPIVLLDQLIKRHAAGPFPNAYYNSNVRPKDDDDDDGDDHNDYDDDNDDADDDNDDADDD